MFNYFFQIQVTMSDRDHQDRDNRVTLIDKKRIKRVIKKETTERDKGDLYSHVYKHYI